MPGNRPVHSIPDKAAAIPPAALLALNPDGGTQPEGVIEQNPAAPEAEAPAVFPQDESSPVPSFFAAETAFDCENAEGPQDWPAGEV